MDRGGTQSGLSDLLLPVYASSVMRYRLDFKHFWGGAVQLCLTTTVVGIRCLVR